MDLYNLFRLSPTLYNYSDYFFVILILFVIFRIRLPNSEYCNNDIQKKLLSPKLYNYYDYFCVIPILVFLIQNLTYISTRNYTIFLLSPMLYKYSDYLYSILILFVIFRIRLPNTDYFNNDLQSFYVVIEAI
jgi:hypothetical protein